MSNIIIPEEIRSEFRLDAEGKAFLSIRASARLLDVDATGLSRLLKTDVDLSTSKLAQKLIERGLDPVDFYIAGIPDVAFAIIAHYYAYSAKKKTEQAKMVCDAFMSIGVRGWIQSELGWQQSSRPLTQLEVLHEITGALLEKERRLSALESQTEQLSAIVSSLEAEKQEAMEELTRLPLCPQKAQELSVRSKINIIVRNKAQRDMIPYNSLWNKLYQELYYRYSYDAKSRCNHSGLKPLDQIERDEMLDVLHAIASEVLV